MQITNERDLDYTPPPEIPVESEVGLHMRLSSISATGGERLRLFWSSGLTWVISPVRLWEKAHLGTPLRLMHFATALCRTTNSFQPSHL
jgi:hypothetical protein